MINVDLGLQLIQKKTNSLLTTNKKTPRLNRRIPRSLMVVQALNHMRIFMTILMNKLVAATIAHRVGRHKTIISNIN